MPGLDGLAVAAQLRHALPDCRAVICTTFSRPGYLSRAMSAGAAGYVVKDSPPEQLVNAIRRVHSGLRFIDPALAAESLANGASPSPIGKPTSCAPPPTAAPSRTSRKSWD